MAERRTPALSGPSSSVTDELSSRRLLIDDDSLALYRRSLAEQWGDGVPLIAPTESRVRELLSGSPLAADAVICKVAPRFGVATVEKIAVNAAMAGCDPAAFPLVIAAVEAMGAPEFNLFGLTTTTSSVFPMVIVNGPTRSRLEIDMASGCMGGAAGRGSMTIGRSVALCLRNIGGQSIDVTSKSVFGQPARTGLCFAEWEEASPWPSLAQQRGFSMDDEVVTVHGGTGTLPLADINNDDALDLLYLIAKSIAYPLTNKFLESTAANGQTVLAVNPAWADRFAAVFPDMPDLQSYLFEHAWQPIEVWPEASRRVLEAKGRVDATGRVWLNDRPDQIVVVVCGGRGNLHAVALPSWAESELQSRAAFRSG